MPVKHPNNFVESLFVDDLSAEDAVDYLERDCATIQNEINKFLVRVNAGPIPVNHLTKFKRYLFDMVNHLKKWLRSNTVVDLNNRGVEKWQVPYEIVTEVQALIVLVNEARAAMGAATPKSTDGSPKETIEDADGNDIFEMVDLTKRAALKQKLRAASEGVETQVT